ncbi:MAG: ABC transporter substrate-binding protein [Firmicutes bacterium]|nr:ABC transporter substrate-binding protein [Bacillota bacterium]
MKKAAILLLIIPISIVILSSCARKNSENTVTIAEQYGLAYAPVQLMKDKNILDENINNIDVKWKKLANTAAIREAMLAGEVDIGFMAIPPFLIGRDRGMEWKIISGLSMSPLGLMTYRKDIKTLADISENDRIALPQPGSIQHILLAMAAEKEFGIADRFDDQLVTMAHPDGMNALLSRKEITAHFTSPPYIFKESEEEGIHQILSGKEALGGEFSFIVGVATEEFYNNQPEIYRAFVESLQQSIEFINQNPGEAAGLLTENYALSEEEIEKYITWPGMSYTMEIRGLDQFINFMQEAEYIDSKNMELSQLIWEVDLYEKE